jgi:hypothetical protein
MYELDNYIEAWKDFPKELSPLETAKGVYYPHKIDVLKKQVWYSESKDIMLNPVILKVDEIKSIMEENQEGKKPPLSNHIADGITDQGFTSGQADLSKKPKPKKKKNWKKGRKKNKKMNDKV